MTARPHCRTPDACPATRPSRHCKSCAMKALCAKPEVRAQRLSVLAEWREANPEEADRIARENLSAMHTPEGRAWLNNRKRVAAYPGIPDYRWPEVKAIMRKGIRAEQAKRMILDDEIAKARRVLGGITVEMQAKRAREKAQAY